MTKRLRPEASVRPVRRRPSSADPLDIAPQRRTLDPFVLLVVPACLLLLLTVWWRSSNGAPVEPPAAAPALVADATYVGRQACAACHQAESQAWEGSHHDLAMQEPDAGTVLGDFNGARFRYAGITTTFTHRDGRYFVRTDGPDGTLSDYEVAYTFGVYPLQQYLIAFPGGRLQALSIAWDSRPKREGGQRWFHLYPEEAVTAGDPLHWTGPRQNWNFMCAECHSTNLRKGYDASAQVFRTSWSEIDVSCEACHGPGSAHVEWASGGRDSRTTGKGLSVALDERRGVLWRPNLATGNALRSEPRNTSREIDTCARCHGRANRLTDDYVHGRSPLDTHAPALLDSGVYWPDGQMRAEVYNWGSFVQSRMHEKGVTCSDCHDPHSLQLRAQGNTMCAQCHLASKYDDERHTRHAQGSKGGACVACHMPVTTYMGVDPRHDHSFRIPRPDLSVSLGVPNACTACHADKPPQWAADAIAGWTGRPPGDARVAEALHASETGASSAPEALAGLAADRTLPAIVRATALRRLAPSVTPSTLDTVTGALKDEDAVVRLGAVEGLAGSAPSMTARHLVPLLSDPVRAVRIEAAVTLAGPAERWLSPDARPRFEAALAEYEATLRYNADRPDARLRLGNLYRTRGYLNAAVVEYRGALSLDRSFVEGYVNLADVYRALGAEREAEAVLREGQTHAPDAAALHHALGLSLVRQRRRDDALGPLGMAARLAPEVPAYASTYALALHQQGHARDARSVLEAALVRHPEDTDLRAAMTSIGR